MFGQVGTGTGQFWSPAGIAIDPTSRNILVTDGGPNNRVQIFSPSGNYLGQFGSSGSGNGQFSSPAGIAIDTGSHNIVVGDGGNHRVQIFNSAGMYLSQFGTAGNGPGQFSGGIGIAIDPATHNIVAVDQGNNRIQIFTSSGLYAGQFGAFGGGSGQFNSPTGIAIDPTNRNLLVGDYNNGRVQFFDASGLYVGQLGGSGTGDGQFAGPQGVAIDPATRNVVVADYYNHRLEVFSPPTSATAAGRSIAAGAFHSLWLKADGTVWAWGYNGYGELGDGTQVSRSDPRQVLGLPPIRQVYAGAGGGFPDSYSAAVTLDGQLHVWGDLRNLSGLGVSLPRSSSRPLKVSGLATPLGSGTPVADQWGGFLNIRKGDRHYVGIKADGSVWSWGTNDANQIPGAIPTSRQSVAPIAQLAGIAKAVGQASGRSFAVSPSGQVWTWGGATANYEAPHIVAQGIVQVDSYGQLDKTFFVDTAGRAWTWDVSQGLGSSPLSLPAPVASVSNGSALLVDGRVWDLVNGAQIAGLNNIVMLDVSIAVTAAGDIVELDQSQQPVAVSTRRMPTPVIQASHSQIGGHRLALTRDGRVLAWGANNFSQLGIGATADGAPASVSDPIEVPGLSDVVAVSARGGNSLALRRDGSVWSWGRNIVGELGRSGDNSRPGQVATVFSVVQISGGIEHNLAVSDSGAVLAWGSNVWGQLALGGVPSTGSPSPTKVPDIAVDSLGSSWVAEFVNPKIGAGHYFITADPTEALAIDNGAAGPGWQRTGQGFRAWRSASAAPPSASPVYRFYAAGPNSHFYTADQAEYQSLRAMNPANDAAVGWKFESVDFHAVTPTNGQCPTGYQAVWRAYNNRFAENDSNHRINPDPIHALRAQRYLGYVSEGVSLCSPVTQTVAGGDLHAFVMYPGKAVVERESIAVDYVFANAGPGAADGAVAFGVLPSQVGNWQVSCSAFYGAVCPAAAQLAPGGLRAGLVLQTLPAGGAIDLRISGTAPPANGVNAIQLTFGAAINPPAGGADTFLANNVAPTSITVVNATVACAYSLQPNRVSSSPQAQSQSVRLMTSPGCAVSIANSLPWVTVVSNGSGEQAVTLNFQANTDATSRSGTITIAGQSLQLSQEGTPAPQPSAPPPEVCLNSVTPSLVQLGASATPETTVAVSAPDGCRWTARSDSSWITLTGSAAAVGAGLVKYKVQVNGDAAPRTGTLTIGTHALTVRQEGTAVDASPGTGNGGDGGDGGGGDGGSGGDSGGSAG
jgi:DNA-binding beta-propeller fold protein YncE